MVDKKNTISAIPIMILYIKPTGCGNRGSEWFERSASFLEATNTFPDLQNRLGLPGVVAEQDSTLDMVCPGASVCACSISL